MTISAARASPFRRGHAEVDDAEVDRAPAVESGYGRVQTDWENAFKQLDGELESESPRWHALPI
jgi:hypothetical protein